MIIVQIFSVKTLNPEADHETSDFSHFIYVVLFSL